MRCTKLTRVQGRHSFLVEYSGEHSLGTTTNSCTGNLHSDMDNLSQCRWVSTEQLVLYHRMIDIDIVLVTSSIGVWFFLTASLDRLSSEEFGCKCQDAPNNTYACVRTLGKEDTMFCQFPDQQEMYSLAQDPHQLTNIANLLTTDTIEYYEVTSDRRNNPPSIFLVLDFFL